MAINDNLEAQAINLYKAEIMSSSEPDVVRGKVSDLGEFTRGKNLTASEMVAGTIPVISAGLQASGYHNKSNVKGPTITVSGSGVNAGFVSFHLHDIWAADCSFNNSSKHIHCLYVILKNIQVQIMELQKGTAQPHVYPKELNPFEIIYPKIDILDNLERRFEKIFATIDANNREIASLQELLTAFLTTISSR